jgi:Protein of unknown function (DUF2380)
MRPAGVAMLTMLGAAIAATRIGAAEPPLEPPLRVAVFPIELEDSSGEGPRPDQEQRLRLLDAELLARLAESGRYAPVAAALPEGSPALRNCPRCDLAVAERLGVGLTLRGVVNKVSNMILVLTLELRAVPSGETRGLWRADFRGNTDESWQRALRWLLRNRVLSEAEPQR